MFKKFYLLFSVLVVCVAAGGCAILESSDARGNAGSFIAQNIEGLGTGAYKSEEITIGKGTGYELSGILTIPEGAAPRGGFPAAVIVHGSGPIDMDGTMFAYTVYRDLADYLSSSGIVVVRYNKRTFTHGFKMVEELGGSLTVYEETIEDAVSAANLLKADPRVNKDKVFIIGHSLGGMLAPRIQVSGGNFSGLILMAGSPRFLLDLSYEQNIDYIEKTMSSVDKENAYASLSGWNDMVNLILNIPDEDAKGVDIGGMSAYYLKDLHKHPAADYIDIVRVPYLVLQGEADFQVRADKDFALYKELLAGRNNTAFKSYEGLSHMFIKSTTGYVDEYDTPDHVNIQVLRDIASWILGVSRQ